MVIAWRPTSLPEALTIHQREGAVPLAGGTDLMAVEPRCSSACGGPGPVMFVGHLPELKHIRQDADHVVIGAAVTLAEALDDHRLPAPFRQAVSAMASPAIRNVATVGGNICNASPCGDTLPYLYALSARVILRHAGGRRELPIDHFILGPGETALRPDELLTEIVIPRREFSIHRQQKVGARKANTLSKLSFLGLAEVDQRNGTLADVRLAFGAVAPTVVRAPEQEQRLAGQPLAEISHHVDEIIAAYDGLIRPIDDQRSSRVYRKTVCLNLLRWFLEELKP
jgi:CO/xanthine dehydrogenase FAD-binding subunit